MRARNEAAAFGGVGAGVDKVGVGRAKGATLGLGLGFGGGMGIVSRGVRGVGCGAADGIAVAGGAASTWSTANETVLFFDGGAGVMTTAAYESGCEGADALPAAGTFSTDTGDGWREVIEVATVAGVSRADKGTTVLPPAVCTVPLSTDARSKAIPLFL
jgi:hypothetical protein